MSRGTYFSFEKIWDEEGQDQDDSNAAMLYCARATKLGGKWTRLNGMTDRVEFLYLRKVFTEPLSEKWAMYLTQREESEASSSSGQPIAPCAGSTPATGATRATPAKMSRKRSVDELDAPSSLKSVIASDLYSQCNSVFFFACSSTLVGRRSKPVIVDLTAVCLLLSSLFFVRAF